MTSSTRSLPRLVAAASHTASPVIRNESSSRAAASALFCRPPPAAVTPPIKARRYHVSSSRAAAASSSSSNADQAQAQALNETLKSTLGQKTPAPDPATASPSTAASSSSSSSSSEAATISKQRIQHGALQSALAFVTVLISAQSLKNAQEKRKIERDRDALRELLDEKQKALQNLIGGDDDGGVAMKNVAKECLRAVRESNDERYDRRISGGRNWSWPRGQSRPSSLSSSEGVAENEANGSIDDDDMEDDMDAVIIDQLIRIMQDDLVQRVGKAGLTQEQQDQLQLQELLQHEFEQQQQKQQRANDDDGKHNDDKQTDALVAQLLQEGADTSNSESVPTDRKRTVYSF